MAYKCSRCERRYESVAVTWRCDCGGPLDWLPPPFEPGCIERGEPGFWRYASVLPPVPSGGRVSLGESMTPLVASAFGGFPALFKVDHMFPSGSFKDRGSSLLVSVLKAAGVEVVHDDSSGNAGASLAAYSAAAGIRCRIYTPAANSRAKLRQIEAYGAELVGIEGDRAAVAAAANDDCCASYYAAHNWNPVFAAGIATIGYELWEQMGGEALDAVVAPAGYGSAILGLAAAFTNLVNSGLIERMPRLFAVQSERYPGLALAWEAEADSPQPTGGGETVAEGIACRLAVRGPELLRSLRASLGSAITVSETEIEEAWRSLAGAGFYVEPTSAVAAAGLARLVRAGVLAPQDRVAVVLTGSGLKSGAVSVQAS